MRECNKRTRGGLPWLSILQMKARVLQDLVGRVYVVGVEDHAAKEVVAGGEENMHPLLQFDRTRYSLHL